jgi:3-oxoadipate enol-lactonase
VTGRGTARLSDGAEIAYQLDPGPQGLASPTPMLLVRPLGGSVDLWGAFRERLRERAPVIVFDALGAGASRASAARTSTRRMARDVRELLDAIGVARAHVYGQSLGGLVATWLAADAPERVARLVLASTAARGVEFGHAGLLRGLSFTRCMLRGADEVEVCLAKRVLSRSFLTRAPEAWERLAGLLRARPTPRASLARAAAAGATHDARRVLSRVRAHTLVLAGGDDGLLGIGPQRALQERLAHAQLHVIDDTGHDVTLERPDEVARLVLEFVAEGPS